jgi:hypothetical protein
MEQSLADVHAVSRNFPSFSSTPNTLAVPMIKLLASNAYERDIQISRNRC